MERLGLHHLHKGVPAGEERAGPRTQSKKQQPENPQIYWETLICRHGRLSEFQWVNIEICKQKILKTVREVTISLIGLTADFMSPSAEARVGGPSAQRKSHNQNPVSSKALSE